MLRVTPGCSSFAHGCPDSSGADLVVTLVLGRSGASFLTLGHLPLSAPSSHTSPPLCFSPNAACSCHCSECCLLTDSVTALLQEAPVLFLTGIWTHWNKPWLLETRF